jgi:hypothetical protein
MSCKNYTRPPFPRGDNNGGAFGELRKDFLVYSYSIICTVYLIKNTSPNTRCVNYFLGTSNA